MRLALVQIKPSKDPEENLKCAAELVGEAKGADLIVLPESFVHPFGVDFDADSVDGLVDRLSEIARIGGTVLVAGTVPEAADGGFYNTCYVFDGEGSVLGKYRKVHLFDVNLPDLVTRESDRFLRGDKVEVIDTPVGKLGVAVCFDVRFPEEFISLAEQGAEVIVVPAAFSNTTGPDHWELLLRARALDSQCFVAGCAPGRNEDLSFVVYGNSLVSDPYGNVLGRLDETEGILECDLDLDDADYQRKIIPTLASRNPDAYGLKTLKEVIE